MGNALLTTAAILLVLGIAVVLFMLGPLDRIVEAGIEHYGSRMLGVRVRVGSVDLSLTSGSGTIKGLVVGNPEGFDSDAAFRLSEITLRIDLESLTGETVVIDDITIRAPRASYEMNRPGSSNFDVIRRNLDRYAAEGSGQPAAPERSGEDEAPEIRLLIRKLVFEDGEMGVKLLAAPSATLPLPALRLRNLGAPAGATPGEIGVQVMRAFLKTVVRSVETLPTSRLRETTEKLEQQAGEAAKELLRSLGR